MYSERVRSYASAWSRSWFLVVPVMRIVMVVLLLLVGRLAGRPGRLGVCMLVGLVLVG